MDLDLIKALDTAGYKVRKTTEKMNSTNEYYVVFKSYKILTQFGSLSLKINKDLTLSQFFFKNIERFFKQKTKKAIEDELSKFFTLLDQFQASEEVQLYYNIFANHINVKTVKLYLSLITIIRKTEPNLYETSKKLLKGIKIDIQRGLDIGYAQLKSDVAIQTFTGALSRYLEERASSKSFISASVVVDLILDSFLISHNYKTEGNGPKKSIWLDWSNNDTRTFTVQVNSSRKTKEKNEKTSDKKKKVVKKKSNVVVDEEDEEEKGEVNKEQSNLVKICHPFVFVKEDKYGQQVANDENDDIRKEILLLRNKLEKQKRELNIQQSIWKMILSYWQANLENHEVVREEFESLERISDKLSGLLDRNSEEWRTLFVSKSENREANRKFLFVLSVLAESFSQSLLKDAKQFGYAVEEEDNDLVSIFEKYKGTDLRRYFNLEDSDDDMGEEEEDVQFEGEIQSSEVVREERVKTIQKSEHHEEESIEQSALENMKKNLANINLKSGE